MEKIEILPKMPLILTKDRDWAESAWSRDLSSETIMLLPEDAVLVAVPEVIHSGVATFEPISGGRVGCKKPLVAGTYCRRMKGHPGACVA